MSEFVGKVVVIAGALGTVGVGIAEQFRAKGATIRIVEDEVGDPTALDRRCAAIAAEHGRLDLIIHCHGVVRPEEAAPEPGRRGRWRARLGALFKMEAIGMNRVGIAGRHG